MGKLSGFSTFWVKKKVFKGNFVNWALLALHWKSPETKLERKNVFCLGTWKPLSDLREKIDMETLIKIHKLKPEETGDNLISSLICRVAAKDTL